jgi:hypothetical protein
VRLEYFTSSTLSPGAQDLVRFDMDSIRQVVAANRGQEPEVWLAHPEGYERGGRLLRDSPSPRLLAYSVVDKVLYASDGCNACTRRLSTALESLTDSQLQTFAEDNDFRLDLLERLTEFINNSM